MGDTRLTITPKKPTSNIIREAVLETALSEIGLIGKAMERDGGKVFCPGKGFKKLIETEVELVIASSKKRFFSKLFPFGHTTLPAVFITLEMEDELVFDGSFEDLETVACPHCGVEVQGWENEVDKWFDNHSYQMNCPACSVSTSPYLFDYNRLGGICKQKINVWNIGKGFGQPTENFLQQLETTLGIAFNYFFVRT